MNLQDVRKKLEQKLKQWKTELQKLLRRMIKSKRPAKRRRRPNEGRAGAGTAAIAEGIPNEAAESKPKPRGDRPILDEKTLKELLEYADLEEEFQKQRYRRRYFRVLRSTISTLITVAAIAILIATLWLPVLQIYGSSMSPTLEEGNIVLSLKQNHFKTGDIVAFYYNNKILVKRKIGEAGDWIDIKEDGTVYVNNQPIDEPYLTDKAFGQCDIDLPYQVPEGRIFVMGDNRSVSVDSRTSAIGCIADEMIVGKLRFCIWPLNHFGPT